MEPEGSQEPANSEAFCNISKQAVFFYGVELLTPRPTPKLEDHPRSLCAAKSVLHEVKPRPYFDWSQDLTEVRVINKEHEAPMAEERSVHNYKVLIGKL
jgi:hypothetical protein